MKNIDKLNVGDVFKNFIELCEFLGIEPQKSGNARRAQVKEIQRFISYRKEGQKCIIEEVYVEPQAKQDGRSRGNKGKYVNELEILIINELSRSGTFSSYTLEHWMKVIGLFPEQYYIVKDTCIYHSMNSTEMDSRHVAEFIFLSNRKCKEILKDAFENLEKRKIIKVEKQIIITRDEENRVAFRTEENKIEEAERVVLKKLGVTRQQLLFDKRYPEFYKLVREYLYENGLKMDYYYTSYKLKILSKQRYTQEQVEEARQNIRSRLKEYIDGHCTEKYNRAQLDFGESEDFRSKDKYLQDIVALGNWLFIERENIFENNIKIKSIHVP